MPRARERAREGRLFLETCEKRKHKMIQKCRKAAGGESAARKRLRRDSLADPGCLSGILRRLNVQRVSTEGKLEGIIVYFI